MWHEKEPQFLEVEHDAVPAIEFLIKNYPNYCTVDELPLQTMEEKVMRLKPYAASVPFFTLVATRGFFFLILM